MSAWEEKLSTLQELWDALDELDETALVLDPPNPTRKHTSRRILLSEIFVLLFCFVALLQCGLVSIFLFFFLFLSFLPSLLPSFCFCFVFHIEDDQGNWCVRIILIIWLSIWLDIVSTWLKNRRVLHIIEYLEIYPVVQCKLVMFLINSVSDKALRSP